MITHDDILSENAAETLLSTIASTKHIEQDPVASTLAQIHNSDEIDVLKVFRSEHIDSISNHSFRTLRRMFCRTLPQIQCSVSDAADTCRVLFEKAGNNLESELIYEALRKWFQQNQQRPEDGLNLIRNDMDSYANITSCVLLAGAEYNLTKFAEEALNLSHKPQPQIRLIALRALGRMTLEKDQRILARAIEHFDEVIESPISDQDAAVAISAALCQLNRLGDCLVDMVKPLLKKACGNPTPNMRHEIAVGLLNCQRHYTKEMIDASFSAIQYADRHDPKTINKIDCILNQWDLDKDRKRVLDFLRNLLSHSEAAVEIEELEDFRCRISTGPGDVLGWYVVSFLLTGDRRLCTAANQLLSYDQVPDGLDVDLTPFTLDLQWVLFLTRKILGYCSSSSASAAALLLSCLRGVSEKDYTELENLIFGYFLINYPRAIEQFEELVSPNDPAREPVKRLSNKLNSYLDRLYQGGICVAFRPSERERHLQDYRQADLWRNVQKKAEENSIFSRLVHKKTMLYGTGSIVYTHTDEDRAPHRQEIPLARHEHMVRVPRLTVIDPVGFLYAIYRFQSEAPPP